MEFFVVIIGLCIGSFLNVCIYRLPREESITFPPSHCTRCGYELKAIDLVPVISYLFLKGRCKKCGDKISIRYPMVEIINGIIYLLIYLKFGLSLNFIFYSILTSLLIVISFIDLESKYIYSSTTIFGVIIAAVYIVIGLYTKEINVVNNIIGGILGYLIIYLIIIITRGMGEGDADIAGICGLFIGIEGILVALFVAIVSAGIVASVILLFKFKKRNEEIAFGPYIALGTIIYILIGKEILTLYLSFFI
ncbi:MAG: prepilin peptidase [Clostridium sartagoforme]|nr:prepilin peptidase [Clostridium sartagoforme]